MSKVSLTIRDESVPRSEVIDQILELAQVPLTARDLISERVRSEVDLRNTEAGRWTRLIHIPTPEEAALNGTTSRLIDSERQVEKALEVFETNGFVLLVDDQQIETLDQPLNLTPTSIVTFLKLTPLKGG